MNGGVDWASRPRYGLLYGPTGLVSEIDGLNGFSSTVFCIICEMTRELNNAPPPPRKLNYVLRVDPCKSYPWSDIVIVGPNSTATMASSGVFSVNA